MTLLYITNRGLLYNTGNYFQYVLIIYKMKESEKNRFIYTYIHITESVCCVPEINTTL